MYSDEDLAKKVAQIKHKCLELCVNAGVGHITSAFSCAEIVTVLYYEIMNINPNNPNWRERDRFVMSKNHASVITYPILADLGFIKEDEINTFLKDGSLFCLHSKINIPGIDFAGGALGIGIGTACGLAYAAKQDNSKRITFCIIGDGECYEGSVWEAALFASHNKLNNLILILDRNQLCITDFTEKMLALNSLEDKFSSFGWEVRTINGHLLSEIEESMKDIRTRNSEKPLCIVANTIKGKGIAFMENNVLMHGVAPRGDKAALAFEQLEEDNGNGI